jgi:flagellar motor component MotA
MKKIAAYRFTIQNVANPSELGENIALGLLAT